MPRTARATGSVSNRNARSAEEVGGVLIDADEQMGVELDVVADQVTNARVDVLLGADARVDRARRIQRQPFHEAGKSPRVLVTEFQGLSPLDVKVPRVLDRAIRLDQAAEHPGLLHAAGSTEAGEFPAKKVNRAR